MLDCAWKVSCWSHTFSEATSSHASKADQLRTLLRKHPTWKLGHLELGEESLLVDDIGTAYASAQVVLYLESQGIHSPQNKSQYSSRASFLLGRCYLRRGDAKRALQFFTQECADPSLLWKIKEERAAAYMVCGDSHNALSILLSVPEDKLTPEGAAAIKYLRKQEGTLSSDTHTTPPPRPR
jgi:hypothetical protein